MTKMICENLIKYHDSEKKYRNLRFMKTENDARALKFDTSMQKRFLILVNLGSPDTFQVPDVRKYLRQFLSDERVIDAPYLVRKMIVEGFILPFRPKKSAHAYQSVWMEEGAPLKVITENFKKAL